MVAEIRLNCFRYLGMQSFDQVDYLLVSEYTMLMKAKALEKLDHERDIHLQAFLNMSVQATRRRGKKEIPVYPKFTDFFDYEKREKEITGVQNVKEDKHHEIKNLILIANREGG